MIHPKKLVAALAVMCLAAIATACDDNSSNGVGSTPTPGQSASTATPEPVGGQAPSVPEPLDATAFVENPCTSLTDAQLQEFTVEPGREVVDPVIPGESCLWETADQHVAIDVTYQPELGGLSHLYTQHETGQWDRWQETEVDGHPAVFNNETQIEGECSLSVGLTDSLYFYANVNSDDDADHCAAARNVASAVLSNIKAGQ